MSYVNQDLLKMQKRRPSKRYVTPEQMVIEANRVIDDANQAIARQMAHAKAWQQVAAELYQDNQAKEAQIAGLEAQKAELEAEVSRLRKKVSRKSGKHKGEEWEDEGVGDG